MVLSSIVWSSRIMALTQSALNAEPCFVAVGISVKGHELHFPKVIIKSPYVHINSGRFQHSTESVISVQTPVHSPEALGHRLHSSIDQKKGFICACGFRLILVLFCLCHFDC